MRDKAVNRVESVVSVVIGSKEECGEEVTVVGTNNKGQKRYTHDM